MARGRKLAAQLLVLPQVGERLLERPVFQPPLVLRVDDEFIFRIPFVLCEPLVISVLHRVDRVDAVFLFILVHSAGSRQNSGETARAAGGPPPRHA